MKGRLHWSALPVPRFDPEPAPRGHRGLPPFDLIDRMVFEGMHFRADDTGVVFHLLGCLSEFGKLGVTAVGSDLVHATALYRKAVDVLDRMAAEL